MFWKKNRNKKSEQALFHYENNDCQRQFVRVRPVAGEGVVLRVDENEVELLDISAGGLAFIGGNYRRGDVLSLFLELPREQQVVTGELEVLAVDERGVRHCRFQGVSQDLVETIHQFILRTQKQALREKKKNELMANAPDNREAAL